jgi:hypothetical protein
VEIGGIAERRYEPGRTATTPCWRTLRVKPQRFPQTALTSRQGVLPTAVERTMSLAVMQERVTDMVSRGSDFTEVEGAIEAAHVGDDEKSALWLLAWSQAQRTGAGDRPDSPLSSRAASIRRPWS